MAIKFVDKEPEDAGKQKRSAKADAPSATREPDAEALETSIEPKLPYAKPAPKKRGRSRTVATDLDRDADIWAARISRAYALASAIPTTPETEAWIARELRSPMAQCIGLAVPPADWGDDYINSALRRWEANARRSFGPRLASVDYGKGTVSMKW